MTNIDIRSLAELARLDMTDEELAKLESELPSILAFVETIQAATAHTEGDAGKTQSSELHNVLREDVDPIESGTYTEVLLNAAPARRNDRIVVKQVVSRKQK